MKPIFFPGLPQVNYAEHFQRCFISINRLETRVSDFEVKDWILDSGAFTRIQSGKGHMDVREYARMIRRWSKCGNLLAAVSQDFMCEAFILDVTGLTVREHQRLTTANYQTLINFVSDVYIMPVIQGFEPSEYVRHIDAYGDLLTEGMWVGIGSVCKRNSTVGEIERVLEAVHKRRPDLRLHGFGLGKNSLKSQIVNDWLYSCDSQAWSFAGRYDGTKSQNDYHRAIEYARSIDDIHPAPRNLHFNGL